MTSQRSYIRKPNGDKVTQVIFNDNKQRQAVTIKYNNYCT